VELLDDLAAARDRQQAINRELEGQMQERLRTEEALQASNQVYRTLVETTGTGYHIADAEGRILDANAVYVGLTGHQTLAEIQGRYVCEWTAPHDVERNAREIKACLTRGYVRNLEIDYVDAQGQITPIEINATVVATDGVPRFLCLSRDITERKKSENALRRAYDDLERKVQERTAQLAQANDILRTEKELFRVTLASIGDAVITTDATAHITYLNTIAERLTGWDDLAARGQPLTEIFHILDEVTREPAEDPVSRCLKGDETLGSSNRSLLICRDERELSIDMSVASIRDSDNASIGVVLVFRDVTEERKLARQLSHQATHDTLTGLVNRREFERRLTHERRSRVQQHRERVLRGVAIDRIEALIIGPEPGVHRQQLDAAKAEHFVTVAQFLLPAGLSGINRQKANERIRVRRHVRLLIFSSLLGQTGATKPPNAIPVSTSSDAHKPDKTVASHND